MTIALPILQVGVNVRASVPSLILQAGPFAKVVLLLLLGMSLYSWMIIVYRLASYRRVRKADRIFLDGFRRRGGQGAANLWVEHHPDSILARVAAAGLRTTSARPNPGPGSASTGYVQAQHVMERVAADEISRLERHVGFLATTGSVSPFLGLMGTVWGVMSSFLNIGAQGSATLVVVAPGIAEALIATVAGLATAIPAVVAYNHLLGRLREFSSSTSVFITEFLDRRSEEVPA